MFNYQRVPFYALGREGSKNKLLVTPGFNSSINDVGWVGEWNGVRTQKRKIGWLKLE